MSSTSAVSLALLADAPALIPAVGRIRWQEWGRPPEPTDLSWWVDVTAREAGRDDLPVTFVAIDADGEAIGAVGLGEFDPDELRDRSPWVLGMVVRQDRRRRGVGRLLVAALENWAAEHRHSPLWVATHTQAVGFYRRCGWRVTQSLPQNAGGATILTKSIDGHQPEA